MEFSLEQLRELITILNQTDITELTLESGDLRLSIRKSDTKPIAVMPSLSPPTGAFETSSTYEPVPVVPSPIVDAIPAKKLADVVSPMVGTFYRSPAPDEAPFVEGGDNVRKGQTVCIIEAMKLMNEIETEVSGRIAEILVENAQPVEYGQVLMRVELL
ncbi:acetyl-CoA carboxylase biotin carboxyl carrier protein [Tumidithrix elongata RA019]|uniref:Biotin carboxyl carrier protein of acetyl-CoA carboxylase n=1 Tax=Tumidithrix elongata BACA0141 TaxID=2716417 RepID=A0AAW9PXI1_9CYAN|nr:acetyl-CoA carboxylase biotin carboxyl carrier protein [Tumidithrix elongata RA019]